MSPCLYCLYCFGAFLYLPLGFYRYLPSFSSFLAVLSPSCLRLIWFRPNIMILRLLSSIVKIGHGSGSHLHHFRKRLGWPISIYIHRLLVLSRVKSPCLDSTRPSWLILVLSLVFYIMYPLFHLWIWMLASY